MTAATNHRTKYEPDGSVTTWESHDGGKTWWMTGQTYPEARSAASPLGSEEPMSNDPSRWTLPALLAVAEQAGRQMHLNNNGIGLGPSGWHEPGECKLCDAMQAAQAHPCDHWTPMRALSEYANLAADLYDGESLRTFAREALGRADA